MSRRKKGKPISGWLLVDKPAGVGSTSVVNQLRWHYGAQKAGHGGTLDPDATGLLPVALGEATKFLPFLEDRMKTYEFELVWGAETTTDDASGDVTLTSDVRPSADQLASVLAQFRGQIEQTPPQVSAVKVDGQRAYDLARAGEVMELKSRALWVDDLRVLSITEKGATLTMTVGKGGYVRSMARDIGRALGARAHVLWLRRLSTLGFSIADAVDLDTQLFDHSRLIPMTATPEFARIAIDELAAIDLRHGRELMVDHADGIALATHGGEAVAIIEITNQTARVLRGIAPDQITRIDV